MSKAAPRELTARYGWFALGLLFVVALFNYVDRSMISDFFPRHRRALAMAFWGLSLPLGGMLGVFLGGQLTAAFGWRATFAIVGLSGLAMTPVMLLLLREPVRGRFDGERKPDA